MRNRYPGICYRCGERVGAGEGHFERRAAHSRNWTTDGDWRVQHADCAIEYRGTDQHVVPFDAAWLVHNPARQTWQDTGNQHGASGTKPASGPRQDPDTVAAIPEPKSSNDGPE